MSLRRAASLAAVALLAALPGVPASAPAAAPQARPHGKQPRVRIGIAGRVAVARPRSQRHSFRDRVISPPGPGQTAAASANPAGPAAAIPIDTEPPPPVPPPEPPKACTQTVTTLSAAEAAIGAAEPSTVICLADGSYGALTLTASKSAEVTLQAQHPGLASLGDVDLSGSHLALERFAISGEVTVEPGSAAIRVAYNRIGDGYFGIDAGPTTTTTVDDTEIVGNRFIGPFGEDAIHLNRYHDGDGNGIGVLIEGNEISGVRENGNHSDCLQTVWVGDHIVFRKNYLHDNRCQGFFVKDQDAGGEGGVAGAVVGIAIEDNLFLRNEAPCAPEAPECGEPSYLHLYGPYSELTIRRNTIWGGEPVAAFQEGTGSDTVIAANVAYRLWTSTDLSAITYSDNTRCQRDAAEGGLWPVAASGESVDCAPPFLDPAHDDFRLAGSPRGVTWAPSQLHFGP
jgi:hypothetical protein